MPPEELQIYTFVMFIMLIMEGNCPPIIRTMFCGQFLVDLFFFLNCCIHMYILL